MPTENKFTPGPWYARKHFEKWCISDNLAGTGPTWICEMIPRQPRGCSEEENAKFIVRAANAHDEIVAALKYLTDVCAAKVLPYENHPAMIQARAAIAKAKGEA